MLTLSSSQTKEAPTSNSQTSSHTKKLACTNCKKCNVILKMND